MIKRYINFISCYCVLHWELKSLVVIYVPLIESILGCVFRFMSAFPTVKLQLERIQT